ncbi:MAG TPA: hypothetical protein VIF62_17910, partial [Labilithrix sp.]
MSFMKALARAAVGAAVFGGALLASRRAEAQNNNNLIPAENGKGFDTHLFRPALDSKGFFSTNGSDILGKNDLSFGLVIDWGRTLLRVNDNGQDSKQLINNSFQGTFSFNYGIANILVAGLTLPVNIMSGDQQQDHATPPKPTQIGPTATAASGTQWGQDQ